jgi:hypothetical protein
MPTYRPSSSKYRGCKCSSIFLDVGTEINMILIYKITNVEFSYSLK